MQGDLLRDFRKGLRMTQVDMGKVLGLTSVYVGMMERGDKPVDKRTEIVVRSLVAFRNAHTIVQEIREKIRFIKSNSEHDDVLFLEGLAQQIEQLAYIPEDIISEISSRPS